jgi:uncharacterized protein YacL
MAQIIKVDGTITDIAQKLNLAVMQEIVGGNIEIAYLQDGRMLVIDEEGKLKGKPVNETATVLYNNPNDCIVGDAILAEHDEID